MFEVEVNDLVTKDEDEDEDEDEDDDVELKEDIVESVRRGGSSVGMRLESSTVISAMNGMKSQKIKHRHIYAILAGAQTLLISS